MTKFPNRLMGFMVLAVSSAYSHSQVTPAQTRGGLLYTTHCIACHTTQMHWRNDRLAVDWDSLKVQVRRWQGNAALQWGEADITEVSRYLNETIYRYPTPADRVGLVSRPTPTVNPANHLTSTMSKRILLIQRHPDASEPHQEHAQASGYAEGAHSAGQTVKHINFAKRAV